MTYIPSVVAALGAFVAYYDAHAGVTLVVHGQIARGALLLAIAALVGWLTGKYWRRATS